VVHHAGASSMFLLGFVNATFETRRPTGNLELVDLSLEKNHHPAVPMEICRREAAMAS
jgi:hypothetical protein